MVDLQTFYRIFCIFDKIILFLFLFLILIVVMLSMDITFIFKKNFVF